MHLNNRKQVAGRSTVHKNQTENFVLKTIGFINIQLLQYGWIYQEVNPTIDQKLNDFQILIQGEYRNQDIIFDQKKSDLLVETNPATKLCNNGAMVGPTGSCKWHSISGGGVWDRHCTVTVHNCTATAHCTAQTMDRH